MFAEVGASDLIGHTLGEYRLIARLGGGAFGQVFRGVHVRSGHAAAIKLLDQPLGQRVITEARAAAAIRHHNVVAVYDLGMTTDRRPYIVMEYLEGAPLSPRWYAARVPAAELVPIATEILRGLAAAHRLGIVHRDLKPANVFATIGRIVIVDFGLAKMLADPNAPNLTVTGASLGTPRYMSPEQIENRGVDGRTDLYALGVMLHEALCGKPPFEGSTYELFDAHLSREPPALPRDTPRELAAAILRALAKPPGDRFANADEMRRALRRR